MFVKPALIVNLRTVYNKRQTKLGTSGIPQARPWPTACRVVPPAHYGKLQAKPIPAHTYKVTRI